MFEIVRYSGEQAEAWNAFVSRSVNGTFLFDRRYMDYHSDRFVDASLMIYQKGHLRALLPANIVGTTLYSHQGLTYGGLLTTSDSTTSATCSMMEALNHHLRANGIQHVVYKSIPWIYHRYPCEETLYALHNVCGASITVRHISSTIDLSLRPRLSESRRSGIRKAIAAGLSVEEAGVESLSIFWPILSTNLLLKYGAHPVHTQEEMALLMQRFPQSIRLFIVYGGQEALGGTVVYHTDRVVHTQYISASVAGKQSGALDLLFDHLLRQDWGTSRYFDFGKSSDGDGHDLNAPLIFQKEGFGGRGICYDWYEWDTNKE